MFRLNHIHRLTRWLCLLMICVGLAAMAQWGGNRSGGRGRGYSRGNIPTWEFDRQFEHDQFRFTRTEFYGGRGGRGWRTDFPNAELNFSWRLTQITSLKVHPDPHSMSLLDPELANNPIIFMVDPRGLDLSELEVEALTELSPQWWLSDGGRFLGRRNAPGVLPADATRVSRHPTRIAEARPRDL